MLDDGRGGQHFQPDARVEHGLEERPGIGHEAELGREVHADDVGVDRDVDDPCTGRDQPIRVGDHAPERRPDGEDDVGVLEGRVRVVARVAPHAA